MRAALAGTLAFFGGIAFIACGSSDDSGVTVANDSGSDVEISDDANPLIPNPPHDASTSDANVSDGGAPRDAAILGDGSIPFPGLVLWLQGDITNLTDAGAWPDQSGHSNDCASSVKGFPIVDMSMINGHSIVKFTAISEAGVNGGEVTDLAFGTDNFFVEVVETNSCTGICPLVYLTDETSPAPYRFGLS